MQLTDKPDRQFRYRAYFWLMNASLAAVIIGSADFAADRAFAMGFEAFVPSPWIYVIGVPKLIFSFFVPMLLVVASFMRDDYAEGLWRRTMLVLGYGVALGPNALLALLWLVFLLVGPVPPSWLRFMTEPADPLTVLLYLWEAHLILFVCAFQFLRWRDSR